MMQHKCSPLTTEMCIRDRENASFRYPGADADTIHEINLTVHPGAKPAIVGLNGAGKTTLVKLLCGLLDPTQGAVLLNGCLLYTSGFPQRTSQAKYL